MSAATQSLSNVQLELLKLYSTNLSEQDLLELRGELAQFYAKKSIETASQVWQEKGLTQADMDEWLNDEEQ